MQPYFLTMFTHMLKSIKDNKDTNFQKLPDNFNFELNGIQIVKPNLKIIDDIIIFKSFLGMIFGTGFSSKIEKYNIDVNRSFGACHRNDLSSY